ncbi:MAG: hypothetical protein ACP5I8_12735 [Phycisphaerae bacterium]
MGPAANFPTDITVQGTVTAQNFATNAAFITDTNVAALANINATKLNHQHREVYAQATASTAAAARQVVQVTYGATGTIIAYSAGLAGTANAGGATITVDLFKNGVSILTAPITISTQAVRVLTAAGIATTSTVAGDVFEVVVTVTPGSGTLGTGLFSSLTINEAPA